MIDPINQDLYTIFYGKRVKEIVPVEGHPGQSLVRFEDGTESLAAIPAPKPIPKDLP